MTVFTLRVALLACIRSQSIIELLSVVCFAANPNVSERIAQDESTPVLRRIHLRLYLGKMVARKR